MKMDVKDRIKLSNLILEKSSLLYFLTPIKSDSKVGGGLNILEYTGVTDNNGIAEMELKLFSDFVKFNPINAEVNLTYKEIKNFENENALMNEALFIELSNLLCNEYIKILDKLASDNVENDNPLIYAKSYLDKFKVWVFKQFGKKYFPQFILKDKNPEKNIKRLMARILLEGNRIASIGRRGPANFIICNCQTAMALQSSSCYTFDPSIVSKQPSNGNIYSIGIIAGMELFVNPNMTWEDTTIYIGRKPASDEPGIGFVYNPEEISIDIVSEKNIGKKGIIKLLGALYKMGEHPEYIYRKFNYKLGKKASIL